MISVRGKGLLVKRRDQFEVRRVGDTLGFNARSEREEARRQNNKQNPDQSDPSLICDASDIKHSGYSNIYERNYIGIAGTSMI